MLPASPPSSIHHEPIHDPRRLNQMPPHEGRSLSARIIPSAYPPPVQGPGGVDLACIATPNLESNVAKFFRAGRPQCAAEGVLLLDDDRTFLMEGRPVHISTTPDTGLLGFARWSLLSQPTTLIPGPIHLLPKGAGGLYTLLEGMEWVQAYGTPSPLRVAAALDALQFGPLQITRDGHIRHLASLIDYDVLHLSSTGHILSYDPHGALQALPLPAAREGALAPRNPVLACVLAITRHLERHAPPLSFFQFVVDHPADPNARVSATLSPLVAVEDQVQAALELAILDPSNGPIPVQHPWTTFPATLPVSSLSNPGKALRAIAAAIPCDPETTLNHFLFAGPEERFLLRECATAASAAKWEDLAHTLRGMRESFLMLADTLPVEV